MEKKYIALTFDDGPSPDATPALLEVLKKHNVKASFFLVGNSFNEETEKYAVAEYEYGCELCNHSQTHSVMSDLTKDEIISEINFTDKKVEKITGNKTAFFRPPYIAYNKLMFDEIDKTFICGVGAEDWEDSVSAEERFKRIVAQSENGTIILLHDMQGNFKTVEAVDMIIPELKNKGFEFVTISELFKKCNVTPQKDIIYTNVFDTRKYYEQA